MNPAQTIKSALVSTWQHKGRAFLTVLGIVIGIFSVTVLMSAGTGLKSEVESVFNQLDPETQIMLPGASLDDSNARTQINFSQGFSTSTIIQDDVEALKSELTSAQSDSFEAALFGSGVISLGERKSVPFVIGASPAIASYLKLTLETGRHLSSEDLDQKKPVVVLGAGSLEALGLDQEAVGQTLKLSGRPLELIGTFAKSESFLPGLDINNIAFLPTGLVQDMIKRQSFDRVYFKTNDLTKIDQTVAQTKDIIKKRHGELDVTIAKQEDLLSAVD